MRGLSLLFFGTGAIAVTIGMIWGIMMSASGDHTLSPAHAHLNLVGWVTFALFGIYYHLSPNITGHIIAKIHYPVALAGLVLIVFGIVQVIQGKGETLAKLGSVLTVLSMLMFLAIIVLAARKEP